LLPFARAATPSMVSSSKPFSRSNLDADCKIVVRTFSSRGKEWAWRTVSVFGCNQADIGKVQVLRYEKVPFFLRGLPHHRIVLAGEAFLNHRVHIIAESRRRLNQIGKKILVKLDSHEAAPIPKAPLEREGPLRRRPQGSLTRCEESPVFP